MDPDIMISIITATGSSIAAVFGYIKLRSKNKIKEEQEFRNELANNIQNLNNNNNILFQKIDEIKEENSSLKEENKSIRSKINKIEKKIENLKNNKK